MKVSFLTCAKIVMIGFWFAATQVTAKQIFAPLPLEVVASTKHVSGFRFSPDGSWAALTYSIAENNPIKSSSFFFSDTGLLYNADSSETKRLDLIQVKTGRRIPVFDENVSSYGAAWSPDGTRLAFYSDRDGEAGLWIWDIVTHEARRVGSFIVRSHEGEPPRWSEDGSKLLLKILPEGMTVAEANQLTPNELKRSFPAQSKELPSVIVLSTGSQATRQAAEPDTTVITRATFGDLAIIDINQGGVSRIVSKEYVSGYKLSHDGKHVFYSIIKAGARRFSDFDLYVHSLVTRESRSVARQVPMLYGNEFSWSPDSQRIAYISNEGYGKGGVDIFELSGDTIKFNAELVDGGGGESPLWDRAGRAYVLDAGALWRLDPGTGMTTQVAAVPNARLERIVGRAASSQLWEDGSHIWAIAKDSKTNEDVLARIDLASSRTYIVHRNGEQAIGRSIDVTDSGAIGYFGSDAMHMADLWLFDTRTGKRRQLSRLNAPIESYAHGETRRIKWVSDRGDELEGALMLPPDYKPGKRLPTLVWVYAGHAAGRQVDDINRYGVGLANSPIFNFYVLTTRGYAVFIPDIPIRTGEAMADIHAAVMPGIDALIAQGYTDPNRLAVEGTSFGSYTTWSLIVQTNRFKAAITTANADPNLFEMYTMMSIDNGRALAITYLEEGQGAMGGDPWTYHDRYLKNSPFFYLDKVETPLLMGEGEKDFPEGADAMFIALRRLGRTVEYRLYEGEGHVIGARQNVIDFWDRRLSFLAEHLNIPEEDSR